jgi:hypothetical protein
LRFAYVIMALLVVRRPTVGRMALASNPFW